MNVGLVNIVALLSFVTLPKPTAVEFNVCHVLSPRQYCAVVPEEIANSTVFTSPELFVNFNKSLEINIELAVGLGLAVGIVSVPVKLFELVQVLVPLKLTCAVVL